MGVIGDREGIVGVRGHARPDGVSPAASHADPAAPATRARRLRLALTITLDHIEAHHRALALLSLAILMVYAAAEIVHVVFQADVVDRAGIDFRQYQFDTNSWLQGTGFYRHWQLTGAYEIPKFPITSLPDLPALYPPMAILLFLPFTLIPALWPLWWAVPVAVVTGFIFRMAPRPVSWPLLAIVAGAGDTTWLLWSGNPVMWVAAYLAGGLVAGWPAVGVLLKPSLAPLALIGVQRRSWWFALGAMALMAVPFGSMWLDWLTAMRNSDAGLLYSLNNASVCLVVLLAWIFRRGPRMA